MRFRLTALTVAFLWCQAAQAHASPITWGFDLTVGSGELAGIRVFGGVSYDYDPLRDLTITTVRPDGGIDIQYPVVPVLDFVMNVGARRFDLSHAAAPAVFYPDPTHNSWGLSYAVSPGALFGNVTSLAFVPVGTFMFTYTSSAGTTYLHQTPPIPNASIPEPASALIVAPSLVGVLYLLRRRSAARAGRGR